MSGPGGTAWTRLATGQSIAASPVGARCRLPAAGQRNPGRSARVVLIGVSDSVALVIELTGLDKQPGVVVAD